MAVSAQRGVFLTLDDAEFLADLLDHVCRTARPSPRVSHLARRIRKSFDSLMPAQANHLRDVTSGYDPSNPRAYDVLDVSEAAHLLGCTPANVRDLIRRGKLPAHRAGNRWALPARAVVERAERRAAGNPRR
ncbi:helix-turn-helix domain-containing protein [Mycobacterium kyogaense]|uniref:helix-turn-helix domain-containing protein n=1 Tax=Mycobacterium kyogaense TaxID=2212479 RepID=UPI000DAD418C